MIERLLAIFCHFVSSRSLVDMHGTGYILFDCPLLNLYIDVKRRQKTPSSSWHNCFSSYDYHMNSETVRERETHRGRRRGGDMRERERHGERAEQKNKLSCYSNDRITCNGSNSRKQHTAYKLISILLPVLVSMMVHLADISSILFI
jgi:hypothetical protein